MDTACVVAYILTYTHTQTSSLTLHFHTYILYPHFIYIYIPHTSKALIQCLSEDSILYFLMFIKYCIIDFKYYE